MHKKHQNPIVAFVVVIVMSGCGLTLPKSDDAKDSETKSSATDDEGVDDATDAAADDGTGDGVDAADGEVNDGPCEEWNDTVKTKVLGLMEVAGKANAAALTAYAAAQGLTAAPDVKPTPLNEYGSGSTMSIEQQYASLSPATTATFPYFETGKLYEYSGGVLFLTGDLYLTGGKATLIYHAPENTEISDTVKVCGCRPPVEVLATTSPIDILKTQTIYVASGLTAAEMPVLVSPFKRSHVHIKLESGAIFGNTLAGEFLDKQAPVACPTK